MIDEQIRNKRNSSSNDGSPIEIQIPRKITLFRVVVERKLGVDFEHSYHSMDG
jgi:hypothetical protein